jgi:hypothetical protein
MNLEYDQSEKTQIILVNISKMLKDRGLVKNYNDFYNVIKNVGDNLEINIHYESKSFAIKIIYNNITTIKDSNDIENFLDKFNKVWQNLVLHQMIYNRFYCNNLLLNCKMIKV